MNMDFSLPSVELSNINDYQDNGHLAQRVWSECLNLLKSRINTQSYKTWFEPIIPLAYDSGLLKVKVPSQFFFEWLEEHYSDMLYEAIIKIVGENGKIEFTVNRDNVELEKLELPASEEIKQVTSKNGSSGGIKNSQSNTNFSRIEVKDPSSYKINHSVLNRKNTFDNFIKGESNQLARAAALAVANNPGGTQFNPLVIYGDVGLGKTHLIQAIGNHALANNKTKRVMYVTSEIFTLEFVEAIQSDRTNEFSNFYRSMDILIVDDIQFFKDKEKTQDHFFHTFNVLHQLGKQIVLSSDRTPKELKGLNDRLISRFQSGLTADIQPPDLETRTAILRKKGLDNGIELRQDVVDFLALNVTSNIRELEGCLISLLAHSSIRNKEIDIDLAKEVVRSIVGELKSQISIENIQRTVCEFFDIQEDLVRAKTRKQEIVVARQLAMYLSKELTNFSLKTIGLHFGGRDHSTVIHACQTVEDTMRGNEKYLETVNHLKMKMNSRGR
jgi:chromosomal replication initiator protein